jgi:hypothetical protein
MSSGGSKKALSTFFARNKARKADAPGVGGTAGGPSSGSAGAGGSSAATSSLSMPDYANLLGDGVAAGWINEPTDEAPAPVASIATGLSRLKMHVSLGNFAIGFGPVRGRGGSELGEPFLTSVRAHDEGVPRVRWPACAGILSMDHASAWRCCARARCTACIASALRSVSV